MNTKSTFRKNANDFLTHTERERGITLIALVITIIVLLILAGVSIATLTGDNGLLTEAQTAKKETEKASEKEQRQLAQLNATMHTEKYDYETEDKGEDGKPITVPIPAGFAPTQIEGENSIEEGLVITDENGNEFVWIPVPNAIWDKAKHETISSLDYTPMSEKIEENYVGVLYRWKESVSVYKKNDIVDNPNRLREPSSVTGNGSQVDAVEENLKKIGIFGGIKEFETQMQNDYNEMVESVAKYHGFYVARYEMSYENGKAQYKKGKNSWINNTDETDLWYGYYKKQREFANDYGYENNVKSSMIWGSQYDAIMNWMARQGINILDDNLEFNEIRITGSKEEDKVLNIYDLLGNSYEWTLEAASIDVRVRRGGVANGIKKAIASRSFAGPLNEGDQNRF